MNAYTSLAAKEQNVTRDIAGETFHGFRVAAYRETHPEHGDKYGHTYSEHWSTPNTRNPAVRVERMFTEEQLLKALSVDADIVETIEDASDDWEAKGYTSALAEVRDMAAVGRSLMEALPKGYCYMDSPAEIVCDLQNELDEARAELAKVTAS